MAPDNGGPAGEAFLDALRADEADEQRVQELLLGGNLWGELRCGGWNLVHPEQTEQIADIRSRSIVAGDGLSLLASACAPEAQKMELCIPSRLPPNATQTVAEDLRTTLDEQEIEATMRLAASLVELRRQYFERITLLRTTRHAPDGNMVSGNMTQTSSVFPALGADLEREQEYEQRSENADGLWCSDMGVYRRVQRVDRKIVVAGDTSQLLALCSDPGDSVQELCYPRRFPRISTLRAGTDMHKLVGKEGRETAQRRMQDLFALRERYFEQVETLCGQLVH